MGLVGETASGFLEVPSGRLYYNVGGDPTGAAVLFIHGMSVDTRMWDDQWSAFTERYRVVRLDLRGFGKSTSAATPFSDMDDLVALLDHLRIERAHVVGLSMGARVVVDFALAHPDRVYALVSADGILSGFGPLPPEALDAFALAAEGRISEATECWLATPLFAPQWRFPRLRNVCS